MVGNKRSKIKGGCVRGDNVYEIKFTVPGDPVPQGRPRATSKGGMTKLYDPPASREYKKLVKAYASKNRPPELIEGYIEVEMLIYKRSLKSFSKKKIAEAEAGFLRPKTKPDADNYAKGILDAMKGIIWQDDGQVTDLIARKYYSANPRAEIVIRPLGGVQESLFKNSR